MKRVALSLLVAMLSVVIARASGPDEISFDQLLVKIESYERPIIVDVHATWCGPCRLFAPVFANVALRSRAVADFYRMDIDKNPQLSEMLAINSVPTILVLYVNGGKLQCEKTSGYMEEAEFKEFLRNSLLKADGSVLKL